MSDERYLPRSVLASIWIEHLEIGAGPIEIAMKAIQGDDEPHAVIWPDGREGTLRELLSLWTASTRQVAAVLPVAGDLSGLAGPGRLNTSALDAGEVLLFSSAAGDFGAVPEVVRFGSHIEPGHIVTWLIYDSKPWQQRLLGTIGTWRDARRELNTKLEKSIERLMVLDILGWQKEIEIEIEALRGRVHLPDPLPSEFDPHRAELLASGWRISTIADLGQSDTGGAISSWEADRRTEALGAIETTARRAVIAATYAAPSLM